MESGKWSGEEVARRDLVIERIREFTRASRTIPLDRAEGAFSGVAGQYRYLFEGEDDLLHLIIERRDGADLTFDESNAVAHFLLPNVPEAMIWKRPGERAHHYYLGHDLLLGE